MITRKFISIFIFVLAGLFIVGGCVASRKTMIESESISNIRSGTWINHEYDDKEEPPGKAVVRSDGSYDLFAEANDTRKTWWGQYIINEAWIDSTGTYWYKAICKESWTTVKYYELGRVDSTKSVWEYIFYSAGFPEEWEPDNKRYTYRIYYRQE